METIINEAVREAVENEIARLENMAAEAPETAPAPDALTAATDAADAAETLPVVVTPEIKVPGGEAALAPISVNAVDEDGTKFRLEVKRGKEIVETFAGLTGDDFDARIAESKHVIITPELRNRILGTVAGQRMIKAMAQRQAQIAAQFKREVLDPIQAYKDAMTLRAEIASGKGTDAAAAALTTDEAAAEFNTLWLASEVAESKLRVFGSCPSPALGMRLALMNRRERLHFKASIKADANKKRLAKERKAKRERARATRR